MRAFNIKAKKRDLGKAKREIRKKVAELKEVTLTLQCFRYFFWNTTTAHRIKKGVACFFLPGPVSGVQHIKGDAGKYHQNIPRSGTDCQGSTVIERMSECIFLFVYVLCNIGSGTDCHSVKEWMYLWMNACISKRMPAVVKEWSTEGKKEVNWEWVQNVISRCKI